MFASHHDLLFQPLRNSLHFVSRRPKTGLAIVAGVVLITCLAIYGARYGWGKFHWRAAQQAATEDRLEDARRHLEACLNVWPNKLQVRLFAVRIARLRSDFEEALQQLQECNRLQGGKITDRLQLEWDLFRAQTGDLLEVESRLHKRLENQDPQSSLILEAVALSFMQDHRFEVALGILNKWLEQEPNNIRALGWRGWVRAKLDVKWEAIQDYERVLELSPAHWKTRVRLVEFLLRDHKTLEAASHLEVLRKSQGADENVRLLLARCLAQQEKTGEAQQLLDGLLAVNPENAKALYERGKLTTEPANQELYFRKVLRTKPGFLEARYALYACLQRQHRPIEAARELDHYRRAKEEAEALKTIMKKLETDPRNPALLAQAAELVKRAGNKKLAEHFLFRAQLPDKAQQPLSKFFSGEP
jgi:tetratricopeptide (TPR) repeat protein